MKAASFKKPAIVEQYTKTSLSPKKPDTKMTEGYNSVKPNNGGKSMGKLGKKARKSAY